MLALRRSTIRSTSAMVTAPNHRSSGMMTTVGPVGHIPMHPVFDTRTGRPRAFTLALRASRMGSEPPPAQHFPSSLQFVQTRTSFL